MTYTGKDQDRRYPGENADVSYSLRRCIHAKECVSRLDAVFDPDRRPWIQVGVTPGDALAEVVGACPSAALHLIRKDGGAPEPVPPVNRVRLRQDGPLVVTGQLKIKAEGVDIETETRAALCRCGASKNKPFCDNSHIAAGFKSPPHETRSVAGSGADDGGVLQIDAPTGDSLHLSGAFSVIDERGEAIFAGDDAYLCRCGGSASKPFCDGTHNRINFQKEQS